MKEYTCKYCGKIFEKPLLLAQHVRANHKRAKKREKKGAEREKLTDEITKTIEVIGIVKGLQASPSFNEAEKRLLGDVSKILEELLTYLKE